MHWVAFDMEERRGGKKRSDQSSGHLGDEEDESHNHLLY
jgi:hypothetical protein